MLLFFDHHLGASDGRCSPVSSCECQRGGPHVDTEGVIASVRHRGQLWRTLGEWPRPGRGGETISGPARSSEGCLAGCRRLALTPAVSTDPRLGTATSLSAN